MNNNGKLESLLNHDNTQLAIISLKSHLDLLIHEFNIVNFDSISWLKEWVSEPLPSLDNKCPIEIIGTDAGLALAKQMLYAAFHSVYQ